jgi:hypothetical protein
LKEFNIYVFPKYYQFEEMSNFEVKKEYKINKLQIFYGFR